MEITPASASPDLSRLMPGAASLRVGFGCGQLLDRLDRAEALRLLHAAIDQGVTYFDTARMYGEGRAESLLREVATVHRDRMTIATKVGIAPPSHALHHRFAHKAVAALRRLAPSIPMPATASPRFGQFTHEQMRASFETSLRELGVDRVDVLLLHECTPDQAASDDVQRFLENVRDAGQAAYTGIATLPGATLDILTAMPDRWDIAQFASNLVEPVLPRIPAGARAIPIIHTVIAAPARAITDALAKDPQLAAAWKAQTGVDPGDRAAMSQLLLAHALRANPRGLVLFSTTNIQTLTAQIAAARGDAIEPEQIDALDRLAARLGYFSGE